jgi:phosphatidate cytidylyltransferase
MYFNHTSEYRVLLLYLFILAFAHDTGAYIIGSLFGKHKIWPSISPKKTWEGFIGGYVFALIGMKTLLWEKGVTKSWSFVLIFALWTCFLVFLGDIFESKLKRRADIKDSGNLLPGHGGFLDRFDGILFAVFFFYFLRDWLVIVLR